jgi:hypothetical protein
MGELEEAIREIKSSIAPGPNGFSTIFFKIF